MKTAWRQAMISYWFRIARRALIAAGVLLSFFALIEIARAYQTLHQFHPWAGYAFLVVGAVGLGGLTWWLLVPILRRPAALTPPPIRDRTAATERDLRRYARYLGRYLRRLAANPELRAEEQNRARAAATGLETAVVNAADAEDLLAAIRSAETETVEPLLASLDDTARRHVRRCVRDVMIGVTISPYKSADLLIVIYRNLAMVRHVVGIYNARPPVGRQARVVWDILQVVATVNFINLGKTLLESLMANVPGGRFVDDVAQGVGAGMMTSVAGHAAVERCRAFRGWDRDAARSTMLRHLGSYWRDVRDILIKDVMGLIHRRVGDGVRGAWSRTVSGVNAALEATGGALKDFVRVPVTAGANGLARAGRSFTDLFRRHNDDAEPPGPPLAPSPEGTVTPREEAVVPPP
jgi:uncharacterized membrane protein YcjF (UPF0283 family)